MERINIGIDLDGVVADSAGFFIPAIYKHFRPGIAFKERFSLESHVKDLAVEVEEILDFVNPLWAEEETHLAIEPVKGAVEGIIALHEKGFKVHLLSHRPETVILPFDVRDLTYGWLQKHDDLHYHIASLALNPDHYDRNFKVRKAQEMGLKIYVEDEVEEAEKFAEAVIKTVFFDPENERVSLSGEVAIANSWPRIVCQLEKLAAEL
jgi:uncharacterized HAD superfamily protein